MAERKTAEKTARHRKKKQKDTFQERSDSLFFRSVTQITRKILKDKLLHKGSIQMYIKYQDRWDKN